MRKKVIFTIFVLYIIILLRLTVFRSSFSFSNLFKGQIDLVPFDEIFTLLISKPFYFFYLFLGNIAWFVPFGYFLDKQLHFSMLKILFLGFLLSLFIEVMQFVLATGYSEVEDLILNTLGAYLGWLLSRVAAGFRKND